MGENEDAEYRRGLGLRIRQAREKSGETRERVEAGLCMSVGTLALIEAGVVDARLWCLEELASSLRTTVGALTVGLGLIHKLGAVPAERLTGENAARAIRRSMTLDEYQEWTATTAVYPEAGTGSGLAQLYTSLGLGGEAGEVAGEMKKRLRGDLEGPGHCGEPLTRAGVQRDTRKLLELGGVLWYLARDARESGFDLSEVADANYKQLMERKARGQIKSRDKR